MLDTLEDTLSEGTVAIRSGCVWGHVCEVFTVIINCNWLCLWML